MIHSIIFVFMRLMHIGSAILAVGALALIVVCAPVVRTLYETPENEPLIGRVDFRLRVLFAAATAGLLISGIYQWVIFGEAYRQAGALANIVLGTKVLIATGFFASLWAFGGESMAHPKVKVWRSVNLTMGVLVLILAAMVRYIRLDAVPVGVGS